MTAWQGVVDCVVQTVRWEGWGALSKGLGASLVGIIPFCAVDLALFNTLKVCASVEPSPQGRRERR